MKLVTMTALSSGPVSAAPRNAAVEVLTPSSGRTPPETSWMYTPGCSSSMSCPVPRLAATAPAPRPAWVRGLLTFLQCDQPAVDQALNSFILLHADRIDVRRRLAGSEVNCLTVVQFDDQKPGREIADAHVHDDPDQADGPVAVIESIHPAGGPNNRLPGVKQRGDIITTD